MKPPQPDAEHDSTYNYETVALTRNGRHALNRFANEPSARNIDRLLADRELLTAMGFESFAGPATTELQNALIEYGYAVMGAWLDPKTDRLYLEANARGFGIAQFELRRLFTDDHRNDLRVEVVITSVPSFLAEVLAKGRWDHRRGASIKTFFIGWCVMQFRNIFRKFVKAHEHDFVQRAEFPAGVLSIESERPESALTAQETRRELLALIADEKTRALIALRADGYTNEEIADLLELSVGAVESRWHRWQRAHHFSQEVA